MIVFSVLEEKPGISDRDVMDLAKDKNAILLTEDSDFGELVFSYQDKNVGIIFIRYVQEDLNRIFKNVINVINKYDQTLYNKFVVITPNKIRVRDL
jgi:predicted nuclease of predicted toxin-antitoxin system